MFSVGLYSRIARLGSPVLMIMTSCACYVYFWCWPRIQYFDNILYSVDVK